MSKKFEVVVETTFRKHYIVEADSEEQAVELATENLDDATDTTDFDTEIIETKEI